MSTVHRFTIAAVLILLTFPLAAMAADCPCAQGDSCGCDDPPCCQAYHPLWYFRAEGEALRRDVRGSSTVLPTGALRSLDTTNLDEPFEAGPDFTLGHTFNENYFLELSYFQMHEWDESMRAVTPGALNDLALRETSRIRNGELNLFCVLPMPPSCFTTSFLVGVRYMHIDEGIGAAFPAETAANPLPLTTQTRNELWGPQLGGLIEFYDQHNIWVNFTIKGALCNDSAEIAFPNTFAKSGSSVAYAADFDLTAVCRITPHFTARFGYRALYVANVALAAENYDPDFETRQDGPAWLRRQGNVLYHGPHMGAEFTW